MKPAISLYTPLHRISALLLIATLAWLTVSLPFVLKAQEKLAQMTLVSEDSCPLNNDDAPDTPIEEKAASTINLTEEFLHTTLISGTHSELLSEPLFHVSNCSVYTAFHGEIHVPPPNLL